MTAPLASGLHKVVHRYRRTLCSIVYTRGDGSRADDVALKCMDY